MVKVEYNEAELSVVTMAESLDVVLRPVIIAQIQFDGHIINVRVNVQQMCTDFIISDRIGSVGRQCQQIFIGIGRSALLHIVGVWRYLELVYLFFVPTVVGIDIMLVVGFTHIEHANIFTVDKLMYRLIALTVNVQT